MRSHAAELVLACSVVALGCVTAQSPRPPPQEPAFKVPRERFLPDLVVAVSPVCSELQISGEKRRELGELIEGELRSAGLGVVPVDDVAEVADTVAREGGGVFDSLTGRADPDKLARTQAATRAALRARFGATSLLRSCLVVRQARAARDRAEWDGAVQLESTKNAWQRFRVGEHDGSLPALSLYVQLEGPEGEVLYAKRGGIQLLGFFDANGKFAEVPPAELLADADRNGRAVHLALDELLGEETPLAAE